MPKRMKVDYQELLKMIEQGVPQGEIMEKLGFKNSTQLKTAYANALMETGKAKKIVGGKLGRKEMLSREVEINTRGSLILPKKLTESLGLQLGDRFKVRKSKTGLSLKQVASRQPAGE